ncbi:30085_t:CDS:1, partial [Racocetra persica]
SNSNFTSCSNFINPTKYNGSLYPPFTSPYVGTFIPNYILTPGDFPLITLYIFITDPGYNSSNQTSLIMEAYDAGKILIKSTAYLSSKTIIIRNYLCDLEYDLHINFNYPLTAFETSPISSAFVIAT